jgi:hypothetical protein
MLLLVKLVPGAKDALSGFPMLPGQYIDWEWNDQVAVRLGEWSDTTAAQEQYLNCARDVESWMLVEE